MVDFSQLKKSKEASKERLLKSIESLNSNNNYNDENKEEYWKFTLDKSGNASAILRFLPTPPQDIERNGLPYIKYWDHSFHIMHGTTKRYYIEKSLTTLGKPDPLFELNGQEWNIGTEEAKNRVRKRARKLHYVANIYVIQDKMNPQYEGQVLKWRFGPAIWEKIQQAIKPVYEGEIPIENPFCFEEGANFKFRAKLIKSDGREYPNFSDSSFDKAAPLFDDESKLEEIWKSEYSLLDIIDPSKFKSYDDLKRRLDWVLGNNTKQNSNSALNSQSNKNVPENKREELDLDEVSDDIDLDEMSGFEDDDIPW